METRSIKYYATCLIAVTGLLLACEKEPALPDKPVYPAGSNEAANQWMLDSLRRYYFWNTSLPGNPALDKEPQAFFRSVLHNDDRFSLLFDPNDGATLTPSLRTRYGFELSVLETGGRIVGVVTLVLKQSPAERAGLKRGDILIQLNGKPFTKENAATLPVEFASGSSGTAVRATYAGGIWNEEEPLTIGMMYTFEHQDKYTVLDVNGTKVGYYFILSFNETGTYSLLQAFGEFKQAGVQEMVIDLRYNYGGKVSSSAALGAMLAPGISSNSPFITYKGNANGGTVHHSFAQALAAEEPGTDFNRITEQSLNLKRVFVLTTEATASASELILNNLKPYMEVIQVGETTYGKDVASFEIKDRRNPPEVRWVMHPVIYKLSNSEGEGNYTAGIAPTQGNILSELEGLPDDLLRELGDKEEALLAHALQMISRGSSYLQSHNTESRAKPEYVLLSATAVMQAYKEPPVYLR